MNRHAKFQPSTFKTVAEKSFGKFGQHMIQGKRSKVNLNNYNAKQFSCIAEYNRSRMIVIQCFLWKLLAVKFGEIWSISRNKMHLMTPEVHRLTPKHHKSIQHVKVHHICQYQLPSSKFVFAPIDL